MQILITVTCSRYGMFVVSDAAACACGRGRRAAEPLPIQAKARDAAEARVRHGWGDRRDCVGPRWPFRQHGPALPQRAGLRASCLYATLSLASTALGGTVACPSP